MLAISCKCLSLMRVSQFTIRHMSEARTMKKLLKGTLTKRKSKYVNLPPLPSINTLSKGANDGGKSVNVKRTEVLNKLFMRYITELMAYGENASIYTGHGLEISRVKITPDFRRVLVYWVAKGNENDSQLESLLKENAFVLRHELTQLRVVGQVPEIQFVKDKQQALIAEVDSRLHKADFGPDYVPTESAVTSLKTTLELNTKIEPEILEKINNLPPAEDDEIEAPIPEMTHSIFRVNRSEIMNKVNKVMKTSPSDKKSSSDVSVVLLEMNSNPIEFQNMKQQKEAFKKFLRERALIHKKMERAEKRMIKAEIEDSLHELNKSETNYDDGKLEMLNEELDYIEEDIYDKKEV